MKKYFTKRNNKYFLYLFVIPAIVLYIVFFVYPFIQGIGYSFTNWNGLTPKIPIQVNSYDFDNIIKYNIPKEIRYDNFHKTILQKIKIESDREFVRSLYLPPYPSELMKEIIDNKIGNKIGADNEEMFYFYYSLADDKYIYTARQLSYDDLRQFIKYLKTKKIISLENYVLRENINERDRDRLSKILTDINFRKPLSAKERSYIEKFYRNNGSLYILDNKIKLYEISKIQRLIARVGYSSIKFIGLQNFIDIFTIDERFPRVASFTIFFTIFNVVLINLFGMILALLLDMRFRTKKALRAMFFMPNVLSLIIVAFIWTFLFQNVIPAIPGTDGWLGDPKVAPYSVIIASVWQGMGYIMVIYLAGLQSIPQDILEVAEIDGASGLRKFFSITLPLLLPAATISFFITLTNSLKTFEIMLALTKGGPGSATESYVLNIYNDAFANNMFGYATAKAVILFLVIMTITVIQLTVMKRKEIEY
ncbi:MAG TPA: sugar ABC transporter permease [Spirochaetota bacterium]|nr:sugar ABC transporter permease [Spirochaetota bacterium]HOS54835.1 sugar ABC transporter permease [Spirochaetota bacterium]HQF76790.1 sugar ABC transporter permease [Spirochaetota bacterium]HQH29944.1 sugar ABC transporter permease [Spirochaetota bacterium]